MSLKRYQRIYEDRNQPDGLRVVGGFLTRIKEFARARDLSLVVQGGRKVKWDAVVRLELGPTTFRLFASVGPNYSNYLVEVATKGSAADWLHICPSGTLEPEQVTEAWWVLGPGDDFRAFADDMANVILTCGRAHANKLAGSMPKCDACGFQPSCKPRFSYRLIGDN